MRRLNATDGFFNAAQKFVACNADETGKCSAHETGSFAVSRLLHIISAAAKQTLIMEKEEPQAEIVANDVEETEKPYRKEHHAGKVLSADNKMLLVSLYREHQLLWNVKSSDYHNKPKREAAYSKIATALRVSASEVKAAINSLRNQFQKVHKTKTERKPTGSSKKARESSRRGGCTRTCSF